MKCIQCERTSDQVPLIRFDYLGSDYAICPEHLPTLIHKPGALAGKLPEAGSWQADKGNSGE